MAVSKRFAQVPAVPVVVGASPAGGIGRRGSRRHAAPAVSSVVAPLGGVVPVVPSTVAFALPLTLSLTVNVEEVDGKGQPLHRGEVVPPGQLIEGWDRPRNPHS